MANACCSLPTTFPTPATAIPTMDMNSTCDTDSTSTPLSAACAPVVAPNNNNGGDDTNDDGTPAIAVAVATTYNAPLRFLPRPCILHDNMAGTSEAKALKLMAEGEKETKRWFGGSTKFENAAEKFDKAGRTFKLAKNYESAAAAYERAAEMHLKLGNDHDLATAKKEAGTMYEKAGKTEECKNALVEAAELYTEMDRLSTAGKAFKQIAEMYEAAHDGDNALAFYQRAAETFQADSNSTSAANQCLAKVGFFYGEDESFGKAAEVFEQVGKDYLNNNLLKFNARTHFTNALMCHMANEDMVMTTRKLNEYKEIDFQFADSRECKLIEAVQTACEAGDVDGFVEAIGEYDRISKLNPWRVALLLKVKEKMTAEEEDDLS